MKGTEAGNSIEGFFFKLSNLAALVLAHGIFVVVLKLSSYGAWALEHADSVAP